MSSYSDVPFVLGTITGIRAFNIDRYGRLRGPQLNTVWRPGENVAQCNEITVARSLTMQIHGGVVSYSPTTGLLYSPTDSNSTYSTQKHLDHVYATCACGFYGFTESDAHDFEGPNTIVGIVEGYGDVMVGERGFRAEKARIVALTLPTENNRATVTDPHRPSGWLSGLAYRRATLMADYYGTGLSILTALLAVPAFIGSIMGMRGNAWGPANWPVILLSLLSVASLLAARAFFRANAGHTGHVYRVGRTPERPVDPAIADLVARNYPNVAIYKHRADMLKEHPVSAGHIPTPNDPDFWDRA